MLKVFMAISRMMCPVVCPKIRPPLSPATSATLWQESTSYSSSGCFSQRPGSVSHTATQRKGPANCLCQQEPHRCRDQVCQHREGTSSHRLCLPTFQPLSTGKELRSREWPQTTWDDCHEEPCEWATTSSENAAGITEIQCHHQVPTREGNATGWCP